MELVSTQSATDGPGVIFSVDLDDVEIVEPAAFIDTIDPHFELGLWLKGLDCFLALCGQLFPNNVIANGSGADYSRHFRLTYSALQQSSRLCTSIRRLESGDAVDRTPAADMDEFVLVLRELLLLNEGFLRTKAPGYGEWASWKSVVTERLHGSAAFARITAPDERLVLNFLPARLLEVLLDASGSFAARPDLRAMVPKFAAALKSLDAVGRLLRNDEPLKPGLVIFAHIYDEARNLVTFINNRLARYEDETTELFGLLDGASYTVAMELKKVYEDELRGILGIRPAPLVYARFEAAYSLLTESFQQLLAGFARLSDPSLKALDFFPNFGEKLDNSVVLRAGLWDVLQSVRAAEQSPDNAALDQTRNKLTHFLENTLRFLFYKDTETFERFCEEIFAAEDTKDLVPVLHRFGAYLETLFGQINMRAVLADRPFQPDAAK